LLGEWEPAKSGFAQAVIHARTVGDLKSLEESTLYLASVHFCQGDMQSALKVSQEALESATKRGDGQLQLYASILQARNYYVLGDYSKCTAIMDDIR
jgi:ATP/maltotriose-dependent transcriptional regulator MalT